MGLYVAVNVTILYILHNVAILLFFVRVSFPSGHSSGAAFATVFAALYIEYLWQPRHFLLLKPFFQFGVISLGFACAFTRVSDYFHHWSDVFVGLIIGIVFAFYTVSLTIDMLFSDYSLLVNLNFQ